MTPTSSSLIDHVRDLIADSGVILTGFSDHVVTFCSRKYEKDIFTGSNVKLVRSFKSYSKFLFMAELRKVDWSSVLSSCDVNFCLSEFNRIFRSAIDKVATLREIRVRSKESPWMNSHILASIRKRNNLFSRFRKDRTNTFLFKEYCKVRNMVQRDIKLAKETYFRNGIERNKGDSGKLWGHLKSLGFSKKASKSPIVLEENGIKKFDALSVARIFNLFYTSVAADLVAKLRNPLGAFRTTGEIFRRFYFKKVGLRPGFTLSPVTSHFVQKQLLSL